jgi:hypothetical protein
MLYAVCCILDAVYIPAATNAHPHQCSVRRRKMWKGSRGWKGCNTLRTVDLLTRTTLHHYIITLISLLQPAAYIHTYIHAMLYALCYDISTSTYIYIYIYIHSSTQYIFTVRTTIQSYNHTSSTCFTISRLSHCHTSHTFTVS